MAIEVFNRFENKYLISRFTLEHVLREIEQHMEPDKFNVGRRTYPICNIYFDTPDDYLIRASLCKPRYKEKLRLRTYGVPQSGGKAFLEVKKKVNGIVNKRRTAMTVEEGYRFVANNGKTAFAEGMNAQVLREVSMFVQRYDLAPRVFIAYDRLAYFEKDNADLRISFDTNIRTRRTDLRLEAGDYGQALLPPDMWLMEIKTSRAMPLWLTGLLAKEGVFCQSFSKYGAEYKKHISERRKESRYA